MRNQLAVTLPDASRTQAIASLRQYVAENMDEEIGDLKAAMLLDYILAEHGPAIYNQAIADARAYFEERVSDLGGIFHRAEYPYWGKRKR